MGGSVEVDHGVQLLAEGLAVGVLVDFEEVGVDGGFVFGGTAVLEEGVEEIFIAFFVFKSEIHYK